MRHFDERPIVIGGVGVTFVATGAWLVGETSHEEAGGWLVKTGVVLLIVAAIGLVTYAYGLWKWLWPVVVWLGNVRMQLYQKGKHPHQKLLDMQAEHERSPQSFVVRVGQSLLDWRFEEGLAKPYLVFLFTLYNAGMHTILVGAPTGNIVARGAPLRTPVHHTPNSTGWTRIAPYGKYDMRVDQYLDRDEANDLAPYLSGKEVSKHLFNVNAQCPVKVDGSEQTFPLYLSDGSTFLMGTVHWTPGPGAEAAQSIDAGLPPLESQPTPVPPPPPAH